VNYLGHAFLSFNQPQILAGNMIGDFVKGMAPVATFSPQIQQGIILHRKIDNFADTHPAGLRARNLFRSDYGLYAGAFVDTLYDHFLANDPNYFSSHDTLKDFAAQVYEHIDNQQQHLPLDFLKMFQYMKQENWLYGYRTMKGMERAFQGLVHRAKYLDNSDKAYEIFVGHYYQLNQWYFEYMDDAVQFVKNELSRL
jgi:acyl carrier protein phosphodiesterase